MKTPIPLVLPVQNLPSLFGVEARSTLLKCCTPFEQSKVGDIVGIFVDVFKSDESPFRIQTPQQVLFHGLPDANSNAYYRKHYAVLPADREPDVAVAMMRITQTKLLDDLSIFRQLEQIHPPRAYEVFYELLITPDFVVASYQSYENYIQSFEMNDIGQSVVDECIRLLLPGLSSAHEAIELSSKLPLICDLMNKVYPFDVSHYTTFPLKAPSLNDVLENSLCNEP